ncbi:hypothetical protein NP511_15935 [Natrinema thermotolerans]|uniref:Uncharacterized protein n=1 Tax=Natrinema thermotolerans TaxID=121872 RepID=A0AAF0P9C6_9EURY|nr:hypothetical protein [Natrinema thermotolerans]WMT06867.1 hypothetical protein NP511_15935 [Natrinema thermotolerans]
MTVNRRDVLKLTGVSMAAGAAGCLGSGDESGNGNEDGEDSPPTYAQWLTTDDEGAVGFIYIDWSDFEDSESDDETQDDELGEEYQNDPMMGLPMAGTIAAGFAIGFGLSSYGLTGVLEATDSEDVESLESSANATLVTNQAVVLPGDIDTDEVADILTAEPESAFARQYERTDGIDEYDIFTPADGSSDAIAVGEGAIVFVSGNEIADPVAAVKTPIEAAAGDAERATEAVADVEWFLSAAGHGTVAYGGYGDEFETNPSGDSGTSGDGMFSDVEYTELEGLEGGVSTLSFDGDGGGSGEFAAVLGDADASALEESLGASADERSVDVSDGRVTASATWNSATWNDGE